MARVESWFLPFVSAHVDRIPRADWPAPDSEFWATLRSALVKHGVTEAVALAASQLMAEGPPKFLDQHLPEFLGHVRTAWRTAVAQDETPEDRDAAEKASTGCDDCQGRSGIVARYPKVTPPGPDDGHRLFYCRCPLGRWVEKNHRTKAPDIRKRIADLQAHADLWGYEQRQPAEWRIGGPEGDARHAAHADRWSRLSMAEQSRWREKVLADFPLLRSHVRFIEKMAIDRFGSSTEGPPAVASKSTFRTLPGDDELPF